MKSFNPNAPRNITGDFAVSRNVVAITRPSKGCWRVEVNGRPVNDWSDQQSAEADATRRGWRGNGAKQGQQKDMFNERVRLGANEVVLAIGPTMRMHAR